MQENYKPHLLNDLLIVQVHPPAQGPLGGVKCLLVMLSTFKKQIQANFLNDSMSEIHGDISAKSITVIFQ